VGVGGVGGWVGGCGCVGGWMWARGWVGAGCVGWVLRVNANVSVRVSV
jgi:hypothetical protein